MPRVNHSTTLGDTPIFKIWPPQISRAPEFFKSNLVNNQNESTSPQIKISREKKKWTQEKQLKINHVNHSTVFWQHTHLKFGLLEHSESIEFLNVNLSTPKSDVPFQESESREQKYKDSRKITKKKPCQPFNCLLATHPFEIWLSQFSRVHRIFQSQLVNHQMRHTLPRIRWSRENNVETREINLR